MADSISKANATFSRLGKRAKRVAIAKDVLKWLRTRRLKAQSGTYLEGEQGEKCTACALGAVFVCTAALASTVKFDDTYGNHPGTNSQHMRQQLAPYFSDEQLRLIEVAFEKDPSHANDDSAKASVAAAKYNRRIRGDKKGMKRIMQNIIKNEGTFKP